MKRLTPSQTAYLREIKKFIAEHGYSPTYRELADRVGAKSANAAAEQVAALERKSAITRADRKARSIVVVE